MRKCLEIALNMTGFIREFQSTLRVSQNQVFLMVFMVCDGRKITSRITDNCSGFMYFSYHNFRKCLQDNVNS